MQNNDLVMYFHIPRTGGTFFCESIGNFLDKNSWLTHYTYTENFSTWMLQMKDIPWLKFRTNEQQKQIKVLSGHSILHCSHKWLRPSKNPLYTTTVRDPVERTLSSFNYRRKKSILTQNLNLFNILMPEMDSVAIYENKSYNDYDTLYEYLLDNTTEQNLQSKWILKTFFTYDYYQNCWTSYPSYVQNPDTAVMDPNSDNLTTPRWMQDPNIKIPYELLENTISKFWHIGLFENLEKDTIDFCNYAGLNFIENSEKNSSTDVIEPKWSLKDIENQPDYDKLLELLDLDLKLYEYAKTLERPF